MTKGPRPVQARLSGTENGISEIDTLAYQYAAARDERQEILQQEVKLKKSLMSQMKDRGLKNYKYGEVTIEIIAGEDDIKVKVKKSKESTEQAPSEE